jgi:antitoxin component of MazEF toxin-antitoxin module
VALVVVRSSEKEIALPAEIMTALDLRAGDQVSAIVDGDAIRVARLDKFLALQGALADDSAFDEAMQLLDHGWQEWTATASA